MTKPEPSVVAKVRTFLACHDTTVTRVKPSGIREIVNEATTAGIAAALAKLRTRWNGTDPTE